jgi:hypothetical protein
MKKHEPTALLRKVVDAMGSRGAPETVIARAIGVSRTTLRLRYRRELDCAHVRANCAVAESLFKAALGTGQGSVVAAIFWLKCRARWQEDTDTPELVALEEALAWNKRA